MSLFGKSRKEKALDVLQRLAEKPHKLDVRVGLEDAASQLLSIDSPHILLAEFNPRSRNALLAQSPKIRVRTEELNEFTVLKHTFNTELVDQVGWNDTIAYRFETPKSISTREEPFVLVPNERDNVTLSFFLHDIQQFKKVASITANEIRFKGSLAQHRELFGQIVYNIELKTPFDRLKLSAKFTHIKGDEYAFSEFHTDEAITESLRRYAVYEFLYTRGLETFIDREDRSAEPRPKSKKPKRRKRVLLVDDKKVITDIVGEIIRTRTNYLVITSNDSVETLNLAVEHEPDVILLDLNMPEMDGITVARKLRENRITRGIPIIFMTASADSKRVKEAREIGVSSYLVKPVDSNRLLNALELTLSQDQSAVQLMQGRVALLCDDDGYAHELLREMRSRQLEVDQFKYADEIIRHSDAEHFGLIILRQLGRQSSPLTIINALRRKPVFTATPIVVFPRSDSETHLCLALQDPNLHLAQSNTEPAAFAANLSNYIKQ